MKFHSAALAALATMGACSPLNAAPVSGLGTWETTLQARDLDLNSLNGPEAYYDSVLNVTWLREFSPTTMHWQDATVWATQDRWGLSGWRLPAMNDLAEPGCAALAYWMTDCGYNVNPGSSELAHLHHVTLGNASVFNAAGQYVPNNGLINTGVWGNSYNTSKWLDTTYIGETNYTLVWAFDPLLGMQDGRLGSYWTQAMAVIDGDHGRLWIDSEVPPSVVPVPGSLWLAGLGLVILGAAARRPRSFMRQ